MNEWNKIFRLPLLVLKNPVYLTDKLLIDDVNLATEVSELALVLLGINSYQAQKFKPCRGISQLEQQILSDVVKQFGPNIKIAGDAIGRSSRDVQRWFQNHDLNVTFNVAQ